MQYDVCLCGSNATWPSAGRGMEGILYVHALLLFPNFSLAFLYIFQRSHMYSLAKLNISNSTWPNDTGMGGILYVHVLLSFHICSFYLHFQEVTSPARLKHFKFNMTAVNATWPSTLQGVRELLYVHIYTSQGMEGILYTYSGSFAIPFSLSPRVWCSTDMNNNLR